MVPFIWIPKLLISASKCGTPFFHEISSAAISFHIYEQRPLFIWPRGRGYLINQGPPLNTGSTCVKYFRTLIFSYQWRKKTNQQTISFFDRYLRFTMVVPREVRRERSIQLRRGKPRGTNNGKDKGSWLVTRIDHQGQPASSNYHSSRFLSFLLRVETR